MNNEQNNKETPLSENAKTTVPSSFMDGSLSNLGEHSYLSQSIKFDPDQPLYLIIHNGKTIATIYLDEDENISFYKYAETLAIHRRSLGGDNENNKDFMGQYRNAVYKAMDHLEDRQIIQY